MEQIKVVATILKQNKFDFKLNIFSQGQPSDFQDFFEYEPDIFLDEDEFKTFHSLVKADVLIMAKSSFSYLAGLLNEGIVIYEPFWHKPQRNWLSTGLDNDQFKVAFALKLSLLIYDVCEMNLNFYSNK